MPKHERRLRKQYRRDYDRRLFRCLGILDYNVWLVDALTNEDLFVPRRTLADLFTPEDVKLKAFKRPAKYNKARE